jgi:hypothetical protein
MRPMLVERLERQREGYWGTVLGLAFFAGFLRVGLGHAGFGTGVFLFVLAGLIPALPHERRPVWDAAMPVDAAPYALIHLVCGIVHAAFMLAIVAGLYVPLFADPEHPRWYPLALFAWGLTWHLLISAAFLLPRHPVLRLVRLVVLLGAGVPVLLTAAVVDPAELLDMTVPAVLARTALPLGIASAAAYVALRFQARAPASARRVAGQGAPRQGPAGALPHPSAPFRNRPAPHPVRRRGPHRPPTARTIFRRHFALLRRFAIVPALTLLVHVLVLGMTALATEMGEDRTILYFVESTGLGEWCAWLAVSWAVLVWIAERGSRRRWNDTLPVGTAKRRILHMTAGMAWLLLFLAVAVAAPLGGAAAAGTLALPVDLPARLWFAIPCGTLTLYLAATLVLSCTRVAWEAPDALPLVTFGVLPARAPSWLAVSLLAATSLGSVWVTYFLFTLGINLLESRVRIVAGDTGNDATAGLWLLLFTAAAAGAIALNDWVHQRDRLPTLHEVRDFFHGWAGTRPAPPLRSRPKP